MYQAKKSILHAQHFLLFISYVITRVQTITPIPPCLHTQMVVTLELTPTTSRSG
eukprot:TRINITY_DN7133_c0_g1_i1.p2 TRINITY_DN7133_c0_g1~~TRINITY_DN7133_c0_g1_i1.p2  ORF type:complete len:54 (+),score=10.12 TRINITY_DN7133_c0_g1_i1:57-218(+)